MMKRILAGAAAAGFAATLLMSGPADAACPTGSQTPANGGNTIAGNVPPLGSTIYGTGGAGGGYIGITGTSGYLEAGGAPGPSGGYIRGTAHGTPVNGEIIAGSTTQKVCLAGVTAK